MAIRLSEGTTLGDLQSEINTDAAGAAQTLVDLVGTLQAIIRVAEAGQRDEDNPYLETILALAKGASVRG